MKYDYLIVGSGLFGSVFAHFATKRGKRCLVLEKREHLGGNIYCEKIEGINVHKYGPHIFHTSNKEVWDFVNSIVPFNRFTNSPLAKAPDGKLYNLPFNMNTFTEMWGVEKPSEALAIMETQKKAIKQFLESEGVTEPRNLEEQAKLLVGEDIYRLLIEGYTEKQWGRKCSSLPPFIIKRLPVRFNFDNNYFNDIYQGIPVGGYNKLIDGLLDGIETHVNSDFFDDRSYYENLGREIVYTGRIDEFYGFRFGKLDYRTVEFKTRILVESNFQGNAVVNYTSAEVPFTRVIEHKHFESFGNEVYDNRKTVVSHEYPKEWEEGMEPFYPVNDEKNQRLLSKYKQLADNEHRVTFGGRLAEYKYYDMAPIIEKVINLFKQSNRV